MKESKQERLHSHSFASCKAPESRDMRILALLPLLLVGSAHGERSSEQCLEAAIEVHPFTQQA